MDQDLQLGLIRYATFRGIISNSNSSGLKCARTCPVLPKPAAEWIPFESDLFSRDLSMKDGLTIGKDAAVLIQKTLAWRKSCDVERAEREEAAAIAAERNKTNKLRIETLREDSPLLSSSHEEWKPLKIPPEGWKTTGQDRGWERLFEIPKVNFSVDEKLALSNEAIQCLKKAAKRDLEVEKKAHREEVPEWRGRDLMKLTPPLSPPLREMSPSYFIIPPSEELPSRQLLKELEEALRREDEFTLPPTDEDIVSQYFDHNAYAADTIPVYEYTHPDKYRFTSPIMPLEEDSREAIRLDIKSERQFSTPPPSAHPMGSTTFAATPLASFGHAFEKQLKDEQLLEDDSSFRVDVPAVSTLLSGPIHEASALQPGFLKANMGLAARKYKGEKTLGRYTLNWYPFIGMEQDEFKEEGMKGNVDPSLMLDRARLRNVERELHEMVDGLILEEEDDDDELYPMPTPKGLTPTPLNNERAPIQSRTEPVQTQKSPVHFAQASQTNTPGREQSSRHAPRPDPTQVLKSPFRIPVPQSNTPRREPPSTPAVRSGSNQTPKTPSYPALLEPHRQPPLSRSASDFQELLLQRKRKAADVLEKDITTTDPFAKERISGFSNFLQTRGKAAPALKGILPPVPLFPNGSSESDPTSLPVSPSPIPLPVPKAPEYVPAEPLKFTPEIIIPTSNTPYLITLSNLLSHIKPTPFVVARDFPYPQSTPDLILSPTHALIFSHERRLSSTSLLPGDKPIPGKDPNQLRQRIIELFASQAYEFLVILLELDPFAKEDVSNRYIRDFRLWARETFHGNVAVVIAKKEELVQVLGEILGRFCNPEIGKYVVIEETPEERELVEGGMNAYKAMVMLNESFVNEEMFEDEGRDLEFKVEMEDDSGY